MVRVQRQNPASVAPNPLAVQHGPSCRRGLTLSFRSLQKSFCRSASGRSSSVQHPHWQSTLRVPGLHWGQSTSLDIRAQPADSLR